MTDLRGRVEHIRLRTRLSQDQLAGMLEITQGHYSKVMSGKVPLSAGLRDRMEAWLQLQSESGGNEQVAWRMQALAASIRRECIELMQLAGAVGVSVKAD